MTSSNVPDKASPAADASAKTGDATRINPKLVDHVDVTLEAFVGDARMTVSELMALRRDAVVPLEGGLARPVELRLNGITIAKGELVAVDDKLGVRLVEISE
jgi:flagellar motor switch protein FliN/FliY